MNTDSGSTQHPDSLSSVTPMTQTEPSFADRHSVILEVTNQAGPSEPEVPDLIIWSFITEEELAGYQASRQTAKDLESLWEKQDRLTCDEMRQEAEAIFTNNGTDGSRGTPVWRAPADADQIIQSFIDCDSFGERNLWEIAHPGEEPEEVELNG